MCLPPKNPFWGFKRPKRVCGTSGWSVNIDFRFLRIFFTSSGTDQKYISGGCTLTPSSDRTNSRQVEAQVNIIVVSLLK